MANGAPRLLLNALLASVLLSGANASAQPNVPTLEEVRSERKKQRQSSKAAPPSKGKQPATDPVPEAAVVEAADDDEPSENLIVPIVLYTPETHVGFGGLFVHFFRPEEPELRVSSLGFLAIATTRRQAILELHPDFYLLSGDLSLYGKIEFQYFPDSFWGIGARVPDENEERYRFQRLRFRIAGIHRLVGSLFGGLATDVMEYRGEYSPDGIFANEDVPGERGGVTSGLGPIATYDTRDNAIAARTGTYLSTSMLFFPKPITRYVFRKLVLDARQFFDLGREHVIALHFYSEIQGGEVPYYHLAFLGGDMLLRGYYYGRYRDETLAAFETEYRYPLYWRFGGVLFAGAGEVADNVADLPKEPIRWTVGGGLRFSLANRERLNLRFDAGFAPDSWGAYFTAREAF